MKRLFLSDLHLQPLQDKSLSSPLTVIIKNNKSVFESVDEVYLLGDVFEFWVDLKLAQEIYKPHLIALQDLSTHVKTYFMRGNRDFMITSSELTTLNIELIPDPFYLEIKGLVAKNILLTHGDHWITNSSYRKYRSLLDLKILQFIVRKMPIKLRMKLALKLRGNSKSNNMEFKPDPIRSSNILPVKELCREANFGQFNFSSTLFCICGHYHKPSIYQTDDGNYIYQLGSLEKDSKQSQDYIYGILLDDELLEKDLTNKCKFLCLK